MDGTVLPGDNSRGTALAVAPEPMYPVRQVAVLIHGLVAIANGPDYCLCGQNWPCTRSGAE
jgi:hypothetical protein